MLYLSDNGGGVLQDNTIVALCTGLARWRDLVEISLGDIGLSGFQTSWILQSIYGFPKITNLDISYSRLSKLLNPTEYFNFPVIMTLTVTGNKLSEEILQKLAATLPACCKIINEEY